MPYDPAVCYELAIVVLNYNGMPLLRQYLPALSLYNNGYPIIVVDNASTDGSVAYLQQHFPQIACLVHAKNYGIAEGYNVALKQIKATYYLLLNNDVLVTANWLQGPLALMQSDLSIACCQPKILSLARPTQFDYAGAAGGYIDRNGYPFCRGRIFHNVEKDKGQYNDTRPVFWASGACLWIRAAAFHALNGFDPLFFAHFEEIDLCWRLQLSGWKVYYCGSSTVYHVGGATIAYSNPEKSYLNFRNRALMLYKYQPTVLSCIQRICLDLLAACYFFFLGKMRHSWAICKAQIAFFTLKKKCKRNASLWPLCHRYKGNIIIDCFIRHKQKFSDLPNSLS